MRETKFIKQNREKWRSFENLIRSDIKDPDKLSNLFIQITDDLSFSRTFYPKRSVRVYLNNKAQQIFHALYKSRKDRLKKFKAFWFEELPSLVWYSRKELLLALAIFLVAVGIGVISSMNDPGFARSILGDSYVDMTIENIESGDPMAVYKKMNGVDMALMITVNNIRVSFMTFIFGIFTSIGTVIILLYNGIMVGTFQYFFIERDLFWESFLTIWLHGTIEISSIIIAGGAGIVLGSGLIFPGTLSRLQSFQISAFKGLKILMGILPLIFFAALIESFVTRYTNVPDFVKAGIIIASAVFIIAYFVWLPYRMYASGKLVPVDVPVNPNKNPKLVFTTIKTNSEIFKDSFILYKKHFSKIARFILAACLLFVPLFIFHLEDLVVLSNYEGTGFSLLVKFYDFSHFPLNYLFHLITIAFAGLIFCGIVYKDSGEPLLSGQVRRFIFSHGYKFLLAAAMLASALFVHISLAFLFLVFVGPVIFLISFIALKEDLSIINALRRTGAIMGGMYGNLLGLTLILLLISAITYFFFYSPFLLLNTEFIKMNITADAKLWEKISIAISFVICIVAVHLIIPFLFIAFGLKYFSLRETNEAPFLKEQLSKIKAGKKTFVRDYESV
jgi:uncharacterized membrane protein SpoIIM required for sporulation